MWLSWVGGPVPRSAEWQEVRSCRNLLDFGESLLKHSELLIRTNRRMHTQQCLDWGAMRAWERKEPRVPPKYPSGPRCWLNSIPLSWVCGVWCRHSSVMLVSVVLMGIQAEWGWALEETWVFGFPPGGIWGPGVNEFITMRPMQWFSTLGVRWHLSLPPQRFWCSLSRVFLILGILRWS